MKLHKPSGELVGAQSVIYNRLRYRICPRMRISETERGLGRWALGWKNWGKRGEGR